MVNHQYLDAVLEAMNFGPRFRRLVHISLANSRACISFNGWRSRSFPVQSGLAQGLPDSCLLFALALEPLLVRLRARLCGLPISGLRLKTSACADDTTCGLQDAADCRTLFDSVSTYGDASGAQLSLPKTLIQVIGGPSDVFETAMALPAQVQLVRSQFRALGVRCGYGVDSAAVWDEKLDALQLRLRGILLRDLPLTRRCAAINRYIYSTVYFTDRFLPASLIALARLRSIVEEALWGKGRDGRAKTPTVKMARLCLSIEQGGFGLINIEEQLLATRALRAQRLLFSPTSFAYLARRHLLFGAIIRNSWAAHIAVPPEGAARSTEPNVDCRVWRWCLIFAKSLPAVRNLAYRALDASEKVCAGPWLAFIDAFLRSAPLRVLAADASWQTSWLTAPQDAPLALDEPIDSIHFAGDDLTSCDTFRHGSAKWRREQACIVPTGWETRVENAGIIDWRLAWRPLPDLYKRLPTETDTLHLLRLFGLKTADHGGKYIIDAHPWKGVMECSLCGTALETLDHLYICIIIRQIWTHIFGDTPLPSLDHLLGIRRHPCVGVTDRHLASWAHAVWRLRLSRRFGKTDPGVVDVARTGEDVRLALEKATRR